MLYYFTKCSFYLAPSWLRIAALTVMRWEWGGVYAVQYGTIDWPVPCVVRAQV